VFPFSVLCCSQSGVHQGQKLAKIWLYTRYVRIFFQKDPSMFLAPYWNISLKSGDLEKISSKSNEELTN
jgi:hypothetical protein